MYDRRKLQSRNKHESRSSNIKKGQSSYHTVIHQAVSEAQAPIQELTNTIENFYFITFPFPFCSRNKNQNHHFYYKVDKIVIHWRPDFSPFPTTKNLQKE
jgi:hypothetical protein